MVLEDDREDKGTASDVPPFFIETEDALDVPQFYIESEGVVEVPRFVVVPDAPEPENK